MSKSTLPELRAGARQSDAGERRGLRLGFVGAGWIGRHRMRALHERMPMEHAVVVDPDDSACTEALAAGTHVARCGSLDELLARELHGVVIATPNMLHEEQCLRVIERGLPVFCQKPLAPTATQAERIVRAARARNVPLSIDWSYRHLDGVRRVQELIEAGSLGRITAIELTFHNAWGPGSPWFFDRRLAGGGCLIDLGVHLLDLALLFTGGRPLRCAGAHLAAGGRRWRREPSAPVEDFVWANLMTECGIPIRVACSWNAPLGMPCRIGFELFGTEGGVQISNIDGSFFRFRTDQHSGVESRPIASDSGSWGVGALLHWASRVGRGEGFDPEAERAIEIAALAEEIYARGVSCAC